MTDKRGDPNPSQRIPDGPFAIDFERLADHSQDAIYHYDIASQRFHFHNRQFRLFFRIADQHDEILLANRIFQFIHPEDRGNLRNAINHALMAGQTVGEARYRTLYADGSIRWLHDRWIVLRDTEDNPVAFQGFIRDDTQRRLAELQFLGSKQNALIGSYIVQEGRFRYVNPQFIEITGYSENELIGMASLALVHEDYCEHVRQHAKAMLQGHDLTPYEFCVADKAGNTHWVMETVTPVVYQQQRAVLGYFMDVTKLHQMKDNLSNLGLNLGAIAHSMRGCLTGLNAGLYQIETGFYRNNPAHIEEGLDLSKLMTERVRKLVADILYYAKERHLEIEQVEVWRFARDVAIFIEKRIKAANIAFTAYVDHDAGWFAIDSEVIRTALMNILENAMEACIEDPRPIAHHITFTTRHDDATIYFEITDNGPGIDRKQHNRIFQLFNSSKGKRGTGIGLFVTRKVILKHGGSIRVNSSPNQGAAFTIALPRRPVDPLPDSPAT